jgi:hypothetical protein
MTYRFIRVIPERDRKIGRSDRIRWIKSGDLKRLIDTEFRHYRAETASFPVTAEGVRRRVKGEALSFKGRAVPAGLVVLFDDQDFSAGPGEIAAADKAAYAGADDYGVIDFTLMR